MAGSSTQAGGGIGVNVAAPGALFVVAFALRALSWPAVFTANGVRLAGPDAHYHLRRIGWSVEHFPEMLARDSYVNFPNGGEPIWSPLFDWVLAAVARTLLARGSDATALEGLLVWAPPLLGAATIVTLYFVARRHFGTGVALAAAAILCLLPPHVWYSQLGFVDHHAAIAWVTTWLVGTLMTVISGRRVLGISLGIATGASLAVWPGCLIHVGVVQLALVGWVLVADDAPGAARRARVAAVAHAVACALVTPLCWGREWAAWGVLSPVVLSAFQPLLLGIPALGFGAAAMLWSRGVAASAGARAQTLAGALAAPAALALALPDLRAGVADAWAWFWRTESFQARVGESLPLLSDMTGFTLTRANDALSPLIFGFPVMVAALVLTRANRGVHRVLAGWSVVLFAAALAQYRFTNSFSVAWALVIACTGRLAWDAARTRWPEPRGRVLVTLSGACLALVLVVPLTSSHARAFATARRSLAGEATRASGPVAHHGALVEVAAWLRENSTPTGGWVDGERPRYGILAAWGDGHVLRYVARRPVVQDNFGDDAGREGFDAAESYFAAPDEAAALGVAGDFRVRYVLVRAAGSGHASERYDSRSMLVRLHQLRGSAGRFRDDSEDGLAFTPALARHRLVYETADRDPSGEGGLYKLYQIVKGARVRGRAPPGELVEVRLALRTHDGQHRFEYIAHARADGDGRYDLSLPYPTEPFRANLEAEDLYEIRSGLRTGTLAVPEAAVARGLRVEGPTLDG